MQAAVERPEAGPAIVSRTAVSLCASVGAFGIACDRSTLASVLVNKLVVNNLAPKHCG